MKFQGAVALCVISEKINEEIFEKVFLKVKNISLMNTENEDELMLQVMDGITKRNQQLDVSDEPFTTILGPYNVDAIVSAKKIWPRVNYKTSLHDFQQINK